jgi:hypothetical protein
MLLGSGGLSAGKPAENSDVTAAPTPLPYSFSRCARPMTIPMPTSHNVPTPTPLAAPQPAPQPSFSFVHDTRPRSHLPFCPPHPTRSRPDQTRVARPSNVPPATPLRSNSPTLLPPKPKNGPFLGFGGILNGQKPRAGCEIANNDL